MIFMFERFVRNGFQLLISIFLFHVRISGNPTQLTPHLFALQDSVIRYICIRDDWCSMWMHNRFQLKIFLFSSKPGITRRGNAFSKHSQAICSFQKYLSTAHTQALITKQPSYYSYNSIFTPIIKQFEEFRLCTLHPKTNNYLNRLIPGINLYPVRVSKSSQTKHLPFSIFPFSYV